MYNSIKGQQHFNTKNDLKQFAQHLKPILIPICTFLVMAYASWVYGYIFCYKVIHQNKHLHKSITIGLITLNVVLYVYAVFIWWNIVYYVGPGIQEHVLPYGQILDGETAEGKQTNENQIPSVRSGDSSSAQVNYSKPPDIYTCDENGYPPWCTMCQSIKLPRTHHSTHINRCVWKFDHYCLWIGQVIGGANYKLFLQFTVIIMTQTLIVTVSILSVYLVNFNHSGLKHDSFVQGNVLAVFVLSAVGFLLCFMLYTQHLYFIALNQTSIESIQRKHAAKTIHREYISVYMRDLGQRYVIEAPFDKFSRHYWRRDSIIQNFKQHLGSKVWQWIWPNRGTIQDLSFELGERYMKFAEDSISTAKMIHVEGDNL